MELVTQQDQIMDNAQILADAIHDGNLDRDEASDLVARGKVFLPFRYGPSLVFAPAKFVGYANNSVKSYRKSVGTRSGSVARAAITRVLGFDALENERLELQLSNYCEQIGVRLQANKHSFWITRSAERQIQNDRSAINDIETDFGNEDPEYRKRMAGSYVRDQRIRKRVLERANGRCEYCGSSSFLTVSGNPFLEAHHVISLSEEGADTMGNVIALCPNDHRQAHFGENWKSLQEEFSKIIRDKV